MSETQPDYYHVMAQEGWICPRCRAVNAPHVKQCTCPADYKPPEPVITCSDDITFNAGISNQWVITGGMTVEPNPVTHPHESHSFLDSPYDQPSVPHRPLDPNASHKGGEA